MLTMPGLGNSSSGFILERLWCIGSPVLLTADSLVGLACEEIFEYLHDYIIRLYFFEPKVSLSRL